MNPPGNLGNMQILINKVWDGAGHAVLLTSSQVILRLLVSSRGHILSSKRSPLPPDADGDTDVDELKVSQEHSELGPHHPPISVCYTPLLNWSELWETPKGLLTSYVVAGEALGRQRSLISNGMQ